MKSLCTDQDKLNRMFIISMKLPRFLKPWINPWCYYLRLFLSDRSSTRFYTDLRSIIAFRRSFFFANYITCPYFCCSTRPVHPVNFCQRTELILVPHHLVLYHRMRKIFHQLRRICWNDYYNRILAWGWGLC